MTVQELRCADACCQPRSRCRTCRNPPLARVRMRAVVAAGLGVAPALVVLAAGLLVARGLLVGAIPPAGAPAGAAGFDIVVGALRTAGRSLLVPAVVVALCAFLAGRSATAVGVRRWATGLLNRIRVGPSSTGAVDTWAQPRGSTTFGG